MKGTAIMLGFAMVIIASTMSMLLGMMPDSRHDYLQEALMEDIRDNCTWKDCNAASDIIFYGAGLCDEHLELGGSTFKSTYDYTVDRVIPEAARAMRAQHHLNQETKE